MCYFIFQDCFICEGGKCLLDIVQFEPYRNMSFHSTRLVVIQMVKKFHITEPKTHWKKTPILGHYNQVFAVFPKPMNPSPVSVLAKWSCTLVDFMSGCTHFLFLPCCTYLSFLDLVTNIITDRNGAAAGWWEEAEYA